MTTGRPARVLVAGDLNVDLVLRGDVRPRFGQVEQLLDDGRLVLGSSAGIAAAGLARLGIPTSLAGVVGDDTFGRFSREELERLGVDSSAVRISDGLATALTVILSEPADRAILTTVGALAELTVDDVLAAAAGHDHVHLAALYLLPRLRSRLPELLTELRRRGVSTSIDTNWDPLEQWAGLGEALPLVDIYLPNTQELRAAARVLGLLGSDDEPRSPDGPDHDQADRDRAWSLELARLGPDVVVKNGAQGGWSASPDGVLLEVPARAVDVVDTTGAGDSFDAGYLAARLLGEPPLERLRWAVAAGSLSTRAPGGTGSQATRDEVLAARAP